MAITATLLASLYQASSVQGAPTCPTPLRRSLLTIIWECWATIFICAWVTVHPNIPPPTEWGRKLLSRRAYLMFWAVVAPEVVVAWAIRQWFAAGEIADIYNKHKGLSPSETGFWAFLWLVIKHWTLGRNMETNKAWTKTHGHFLCMGGFVAVQVEGANHDPISENATDNGEVISFESFKRLIKDGNFDVSITEREIEDKSKRDSLSKAIAILQTSRFIANCFARWRQKLALTELELVTLALASLNAITYTFWWAKPYDVKVPVKIYVKADRHSQNESRAQLPKRRATGGSIDENEDPTKSMFPFTANDFRRKNFKFFKNILFEIFYILLKSWRSDDFRVLIFRWFFMLPICVTFVLFFPIYFIVVYIFASLNDIVDTVNVPPGAAYVPIFYAPRTKAEGVFRFVIFAIFGVIFGGVHCFGWHFTYPTPIEQKLWRFSSVAITVIPFVSMLVMLISSMVSQSKRMRGDRLVEKIVNVVNGAAITFGTLQLFVYVLARLALLGQAAATLRALSQSARQEITWLRFLPHVEVGNG